MKICPNCAEKLSGLKEICPKCGIVLGKSKSPVLIGLVIAAGLIALVVMGLIFSKPL